MELAGAARRGGPAGLQLAGAAGGIAESGAQLRGTGAGLAEAGGQAAEVPLAALQQLLGVIEALGELLEVLGRGHQRARPDDRCHLRVVRDLGLEAVDRVQQRGARDGLVARGDDDVVGRRPARAHRGVDGLEVLARLRGLGQLVDVGGPGVEAERGDGEDEQRRDAEAGERRRVARHPAAAGDEPCPRGRDGSRRREASGLQAVAEDDEDGGHDHRCGPGAQQDAEQHADAERLEDDGGRDQHGENQAHREGGAAPQDGAPARGDGARGGHPGRVRLGAERALLAEALDDHQGEADAERQAGERADRDGGGVGVDGAGQQRHHAHAGKDGRGAEGGDDESGDGRAQEQQQDEEEQRDRQQLGAARLLDHRGLQSGVDGGLPSDVGAYRRLNAVVDQPLDLREVGLQHRGLRAVDRDHDHPGRGRGPQRCGGRARVPRREHARVRPRAESHDEGGPLFVDRRLGAAQQDRRQLAGAELGVGQVLGARRLAARDDEDRW